MKKFRILFLCLLLVILTAVPVCAANQDASAQTTVSTKKKTVKKGFVQAGSSYYYYENGKKIKNRWKTIRDPDTGKKYRYYFGEDGRAVAGKTARINDIVYLFNKKGRLVRPSKKRIVTINGRRYYVNTDGRVETGWLLINNKLYRADREGKFFQKRVYGDISFDHVTGAARTSTASSLKIKTMTIVNSITTAKMNKSQKLRACWNYVTWRGGFYYTSIYPNLNQSGWQKSLALRMLTYKGGNCYGFACAFAALAKEVGYSPKLVCGRVSGSRDGAADGLTRHCWVIINGRYYDPEAQWKGWMRGVYGSWGYPITHTIQRIVTF